MKKFFRIVIKGGPPVIFFDLEVPAEASLPNFMANVTMHGAVVQEQIYVPIDQIAHVSVVTQEQAQMGPWKPKLV